MHFWGSKLSFSAFQKDRASFDRFRRRIAYAFYLSDASNKWLSTGIHSIAGVLTGYGSKIKKPLETDKVRTVSKLERQIATLLPVARAYQPPSGCPSTVWRLVAPYRSILRYYRCDTSYRAILFREVGAPPKWCDTPPLLLSFTQAHLCDTLFCNISRDNCAMPQKQARKSFAILSLLASRDMKSIATGPLRWRTV